MGEPDPWGSIINRLWVAHVTAVEEAWDHAADSNAVPHSEEPLLSPLLYFTGSICTVPVLGILRPRRQILVGSPYFTLTPVQSSVAPVAATDCPRIYALVIQEPSDCVNQAVAAGRRTQQTVGAPRSRRLWAHSLC